MLAVPGRKNSSIQIISFIETCICSISDINVGQFCTFSAMSAMALLLGGRTFNAFVSGFVACLNISSFVGGWGIILVKHVGDKLLFKKFSFGPEKDFFIQSPTSLANNFQAVFWTGYTESPDFLK